MLYTVQEVAEHYGVHPNSVLMWIQTGELKAVNVGSKIGVTKSRWRITQKALEDFEEARTAKKGRKRVAV